MGYASLSTSFLSTSGYFQYLILGWPTMLLSPSYNILTYVPAYDTITCYNLKRIDNWTNECRG